MENVAKWEEMSIPVNKPRDNFIIQSLPKSFNKKYGVKFHIHKVVENEHVVEKVDLKYEINSVNEMQFIKIYTDKYDISKIDIHFFIVTETYEMLEKKRCSCGSDNTENYQYYCNDCGGIFDAV